MSRNLIDYTLWTRANTQNSGSATSNLCAACIVYDLRAETQTHGLRLQYKQFFLPLDLNCDFCLTPFLPSSQHRGRILRSPFPLEESFVASQSGMRALRGYLSCKR